MQDFEVSGLLLATTMDPPQQNPSLPPGQPTINMEQQSVETGPAMSNAHEEGQRRESNSGELRSTSLDSTTDSDQGAQSTPTQSMSATNDDGATTIAPAVKTPRKVKLVLKVKGKHEPRILK
jgi:hypothetical protein